MIAFRQRRTVATAAPVLAPSAPLAESAARLAARHTVRQRAGHELADQIADVERRAVEYVVLTEGIARSARRIEALLDVDRHRDDHLVQTAATRPLDVDLDRSVDLEPSSDAAQLESRVRRMRKRELRERRNLDPLVEGHRTPCEQNRPDVYYQRRTHTIERGPPRWRDPMSNRAMVDGRGGLVNASGRRDGGSR